jgi:hypothetical protein
MKDTPEKLDRLYTLDPYVPREDLCILAADCACSLTDVKEGARGCVNNNAGLQHRNGS